MLHRRQPAAHLGLERIERLEPGESGDGGEPASRSGRLWVCRSSTICRRCSTRRRKPYAAISSSAAPSPIRAAAASAAQRLAGAAEPQRGIAAAEDELLGLGEELDLADAAAAELHVVARHLDRAAAAMGVDLALDRMDVVDRGEVEMPPPDEGPKRRRKASPAARLPATGAP